LVYVWRETGAVRNARPSRGQAAVHPEEGAVEGRREAIVGFVDFEVDSWFTASLVARSLLL